MLKSVRIARRLRPVLLRTASARALSSSTAWEEATDPSSGKTYWWNKETQETSWEPPPPTRWNSAPKPVPVTPQHVKTLRALEKRAIWLSAYTIYHANMIRPSRDGVKVGGHQASSTSLATILTALYFSALRPQDRVAVKPHAGPIFHAIQYMCGKQTREKLENFRSLGGVQSYPSITKDDVDVDFSTGSVGLGAAATMFSSIFQDYLIGRGLAPLGIPGSAPPSSTSSGPSDDPTARYIALVGDAELDEGSVYEALYEGQKHGIKNNWWFIDYNRQSLDRMSADGSWRGIDKMFRSNGWRVLTLKYGATLERAFEEAGPKFRGWLNDVTNDEYGVLSSGGGSAFRASIETWMASDAAVAGDTTPNAALARPQLAVLTRWLSEVDDETLLATCTNLGGHDIQTVLKAIELASKDDIPTCFICYTIKGHGLGPVAGHRDNHGMQMNAKQIDALRVRHGVPEGSEWEPLVAVDGIETAELREFVDAAPFNIGEAGGGGGGGRRAADARWRRDLVDAEPILDVPKQPFDTATAKSSSAKLMSTQVAFGNVMAEIGKSDAPFADRVVTMAPDVATTTNLGQWVNRRGVWGPSEREDKFKKEGGLTLNKWGLSPMGQHFELGIAENNLFTAMASAGLTVHHTGRRLLPVGTLYDPFIARGLGA
jgi:pyruvate dehydrogenase E1 component